ncbi:hypothetical protein DYB28_005156 [Aphanomyces astaci]|uniref:Uncharacterized protein n=1 Tax=Aphanomyces astaci TaxID=112090 RepID=A0A9X8DZI2_APHAT|nr:hypothetical protein DYB28_005156 [Aphanomyces astaci]
MRLRLPALLQRTMTRASTAMAASSWSLCVDFDDTCSVRDTTADLARLACTGNHPQTSEVWDSLVARFLEDCASVMSTLGDDLGQKSLTFQPQMLDAFLAAYSAVDLRSVDRVMASRVLAGIPRSSIVNRVALKPDCAHVLSTWPGDVTVVSSNWSRTSVLSALTDVARARHRAGLPFAVHANGWPCMCVPSQLTQWSLVV